jgi:hypothetical protein
MEFIAYITKQVARGELGIAFLFESCLKQDQLRVKLSPWMGEWFNRILFSGYQANR